ncbi:P-loop containing nucleoside triphosphate hydrolase protein [Naematelia encephala]|uniref:p-loop containing nucleoside triphosphate hydrolase protein n=1 Tax=Naematelia encephala TaxID=71784 RepID=A0A1Y2BGY3_9TREE|nr:P-loop containing nucleoside triphosphate hydrolase protein [Naematelia encephala]
MGNLQKHSSSVKMQPTTSTMKEETERLAKKIVEAYKEIRPERRLLVAVAGPPGSGKSTLAYPLADKVNALVLQHPVSHPAVVVDDQERIAAAGQGAGEADEVCVCVGLDGWHYPREELDTFEDPVDAHWRRGAAFTFNLPSYLTFIQQLRLPLIPCPPIGIPYPTFDHALKDPRPSPTPITPRHRIIIIEGLYTLLSKDGWRQCAEMMDLRIFVDVDPEEARQRVIRRNFEAGIVDNLEKCAERVDAVDMKNADEVRRYMVTPTDVIMSVHEVALEHVNGS